MSDIFEMLDPNFLSGRRGPWRLTIKGVRPLITTDQENESDEHSHEVATRISKILHGYETKIERLSTDAHVEFGDLIDNFEFVTNVDELNECLTQLYDLCDEYRFWIDFD